MESTTKLQQQEDSWNPQWPKKSWMLALRNRLQMTYGNRFQGQTDDASVLLWVETWGQGLAGITGEQLKWGLEQASKDEGSFPPTLGVFRSWCLHMPQAHVPQLEHQWQRSTVAEQSIEKIRKLLSAPHRPNRQWAYKIMEKIERGEPVILIARQMAEEALKWDSDAEAAV
mgnify:CR=1 FL=1